MSIETTKKFIETHNLNEKVSMSDAGVFEIPDGLFEEVVLQPAGVTAEQYAQVHEGAGQLAAAVSYVFAEKAAPYMKENESIAELGYSYNASGATVSGIIDRSGALVTVVDTKYKSSAMTDVVESVASFFEDVNS
ncbi:hypothetical protein RVBP18_0470 [Pseudomonas phage sp. LC]|nr:hypothetical protein RVBP18_0470 [Pseudomonas phage sp. LC]